MILLRPLRWERYDKAHPSALYHADWAVRYANRAVVAAAVAFVGSIVALVLDLCA